MLSCIGLSVKRREQATGGDEATGIEKFEGFFSSNDRELSPPLLSPRRTRVRRARRGQPRSHPFRAGRAPACSARWALRSEDRSIETWSNREERDLRSRLESVGGVAAGGITARGTLSPARILPRRPALRSDATLTRMGHGALDVLVRRASLAEAFSTRETPPSEIIALAIIGGSKKAIAFSFFFLSFLFSLTSSSTSSFNSNTPQQAKSTARSLVPARSAARPRRSPSRTRRSSPR